MRIYVFRLIATDEDNYSQARPVLVHARTRASALDALREAVKEGLGFAKYALDKGDTVDSDGDDFYYVSWCPDPEDVGEDPDDPDFDAESYFDECETVSYAVQIIDVSPAESRRSRGFPTVLEAADYVQSEHSYYDTINVLGSDSGYPVFYGTITYDFPKDHWIWDSLSVEDVDELPDDSIPRDVSLRAEWGKKPRRRRGARRPEID